MRFKIELFGVAIVAAVFCLLLATERTTPAQIIPPTQAPIMIAPSSGVNGAGTVSAPVLLLPTITFATLPASTNGTILYCSDCTVTTAATCPGTQASCVCATAGAGAFARRVAGAWYCTF